MIITSVIKNLLWALRYPSFPSVVGDYNVGAIQTRIPNGPACQIHYPTLDRRSSEQIPYMRPQAVEGLADYSRQNVALLEYLSKRQHPCIIQASPIPETQFPIVIFSHGLGGCMEMYTTLCQQIASQGYWVVAVEHEEGSGAYAETHTGEPIYYKRPDDTPYSRNKVVQFRKDFLHQRVQEIQSVLEYVSQTTDKETTKDPLVQQVMNAADTNQGIHLVGHSFGGATMVQFLQRLQRLCSVESLSVLDCWAFSLPDHSIEQGIDSTRTLSILSEAWLTNPETAQVKQLLQASTQVESWYIPNSVHASFSDATHWLPGVISRKMGLRAPAEAKHDTIRTAARACVQHFQKQPIMQQDMDLQEFRVEAVSPTVDVAR